jgi:hypothetical protein
VIAGTKRKMIYFTPLCIFCACHSYARVALLSSYLFIIGIAITMIIFETVAFTGAPTFVMSVEMKLQRNSTEALECMPAHYN